MQAFAMATHDRQYIKCNPDTLLPENALTKIKTNTQTDGHDAGGFRHSFGRQDWRLRFISFLDNRRCQQTNIIYGDQTIFVKRELFKQLRGFPDVAIMEDIHLYENWFSTPCPSSSMTSY